MTDWKRGKPDPSDCSRAWNLWQDSHYKSSLENVVVELAFFLLAQVSLFGP
jgi:hypothetical protein